MTKNVYIKSSTPSKNMTLLRATAPNGSCDGTGVEDTSTFTVLTKQAY